MKELVILGAGTAGTMMANKLVRLLPDCYRVTVIDRDKTHLYQPGLLFVPFGDYREDEIVRPRKSTLDSDVRLVFGEIDRVDPEAQKVHIKGGDALTYDLLIVATGTKVLPEQTDGLTGEGWYKTAFDFYTLEGAKALREGLERFEGGRLVINIADMPIKCPVAPLEFAFLADAYLTKRGLRDKTEMVYATPLEGAFTKPKASQLLGQLMVDRNIKVEPDFQMQSVNGEKRVVTAYDGRELDYDLFVTIPLHGGSDAIRKSEMGDAMGFVPTDKHTLQTKAFKNIFALGDATDLPSSKAGAVAHFQAEVLVGNVMRFLEGRELLPDFDGHANCFIETGYDKGLLIDFNYETEPLPGKFPLPGIGPFTLLKESRANHWGKLGFKWVYWNLLVRGEELPLDHRMLMAGKQR